MGSVAGAALVSAATWAAGEAKQSTEQPIGYKFWPSEFGAGDQRGATNGITPEDVVRSARLVKTDRAQQNDFGTLIVWFQSPENLPAAPDATRRSPSL